MDIYIYKLRFKGPVHFGETGIELENVTERIYSDTLFSALINAMNIIYGQNETDQFVKKFTNAPPFLISSLFLYDKNTIYFPRPFVDEQLHETLKRKFGKELKKITWLSNSMFLKWISGDMLNEDNIEAMIKDQENYKRAYEVEIRPRVSLDRNTQNSNLYHSGYVHFEKNAGLYGLLAVKDNQTLDLFKNLLKNLGDIGLGGEKTYGSGLYEVLEFSKVDGVLFEIFKAISPWHVSLSLYHPSPDEMSKIKENAVAYDLIRRKGWITTGRNSLPLKKKSVGFFVEGSVFKGCPNGCLVDVTPDTYPDKVLKHKVYRYGFAFTAPFGG